MAALPPPPPVPFIRRVGRAAAAGVTGIRNGASMGYRGIRAGASASYHGVQGAATYARDHPRTGVLAGVAVLAAAGLVYTKSCIPNFTGGAPPSATSTPTSTPTATQSPTPTKSLEVIIDERVATQVAAILTRTAGTPTPAAATPIPYTPTPTSTPTSAAQAAPTKAATVITATPTLTPTRAPTQTATIAPYTPVPTGTSAPAATATHYTLPAPISTPIPAATAIPYAQPFRITDGGWAPSSRNIPFSRAQNFSQQAVDVLRSYFRDRAELSARQALSQYAPPTVANELAAQSAQRVRESLDGRLDNWEVLGDGRTGVTLYALQLGSNDVRYMVGFLVTNANGSLSSFYTPVTKPVFDGLAQRLGMDYTPMGLR